MAWRSHIASLDRGFFGSLRNEKQFPVAIWVLAAKPQSAK